MYQKYRSQLFREICLYIWAENNMALSPSLGLFIGPIAFVNPRNGLVSQKNLFFQADSRLVKLKVRINRMNLKITWLYPPHWDFLLDQYHLFSLFLK